MSDALEKALEDFRAWVAANVDNPAVRQIAEIHFVTARVIFETAFNAGLTRAAEIARTQAAAHVGSFIWHTVHDVAAAIEAEKEKN